MKIDRPTIWKPPEPLQEKSETPAPGKAVDEPAKEPVQLENSFAPKTDIVEMRENSNHILDKIAEAPKLDTSQVNLEKGNEVSAALLPGVPFREKVELPKTLPNGTSVNSGVGSGDLGFGKTRPGPNHMGIDMKGNEIKNQLNDALNLKTGTALQSSTPPTAGTVNDTGLPGKPATSSGDSAMGGPRTDTTYHAGLKRPGMDRISQQKDDGRMGLFPNLAPEVKGPTGADQMAERERKMKEKSGGGKSEFEKWKEATVDGGTYTPNKMSDPDAPGAQAPVVTKELLDKVQLRKSANTQPGVEEYLEKIDGSKLSDADPRRKLISNPNPEDQSTVSTSGDPHVVMDAKGPDTVNPNDPELGGGGGPITIDPNRPK